MRKAKKQQELSDDSGKAVLPFLKLPLLLYTSNNPAVSALVHFGKMKRHSGNNCIEMNALWRDNEV